MNESRTLIKTKIGGDLFDLVKLILSLFVFLLHAHALHLTEIPILRIAVPLFFIMTSYFFFSKYDAESDSTIKKSIFRKYVVRNVLLYLIWTVVFICAILQQRGWFDRPFPESIVYLLRALAFGSTFIASWFISSCVFATAISISISKKGVNIPSVILAIIFFLFSALFSNYRYAFPISDAFFDSYTKVFCYPYLSFVIAFAWITIGRFFASRTIKTNGLILGCIVLVALALLFIENRIIDDHAFHFSQAVYLSLAMLCPALFALLLKAPQVHIPYASEMRHLSIVIFCTHGSLLYIFGKLFEAIGIVHNMRWATLITLPCCFIIYLIVDFLAKRVKFFKFAY